MDPNDTSSNSNPPSNINPSNPNSNADPTIPANPSSNTDPTTPARPMQPADPMQPTSTEIPSAPTRTTVTAFLGTLLATAVLGVPAGYLWALIAPRALAQVVSRGAANVVNAETTAFIVADAWFVLIAAIGGLLTGIVGYRYVVRRPAARGTRAAPAATLGLILGGLGATALMWWIGDNYGRASFHHALLTKPAGTYLHADLTLGAKSAIIFWPLFAALAIAVPELIAYARGHRSSGVRDVDEAGEPEAGSVD